MQYNVASILKLSPGSVRSYALDAGQQVPLDDELTLLVESGDVRLSRTNRGLLARGAVHGRVDRLTCSRCLSDMAITLDVPFEDEYLPTIDINLETQPTDRPAQCLIGALKKVSCPRRRLKGNAAHTHILGPLTGENDQSLVSSGGRPCEAAKSVVHDAVSPAFYSLCSALTFCSTTSRPA